MLKGSKLSEETKKKISQRMLSNHHRCNLGKHFSSQTKLKMSIAKLGKPRSEETKKKISEKHIIRMSNPANRKRISLVHIGKTTSAATKLKMRISAINNIKQTNSSFFPRTGKYETAYLDWLETVIGYKIIRQFPINGYFIDGYCKERNLAIELDEKRHQKPNTIQRDIFRQQEIQNYLECQFIRIRV